LIHQMAMVGADSQGMNIGCTCALRERQESEDE
jgi:hypothetical protein